jgi:GH25 family lysozyme M1 (1,4-beta-N-acetylmuramidase)
MTRFFALVALAAFSIGDDTPEPSVAQVRQTMNVCAGPSTVYGIDVSRFQGDIDWDQVAASGVKYAFIQISRSLTDIDATFPYNWQRAKEVGILRGAYQRFQPDQDAIAQAELFVQKLGPYVAGDLPPVLDVEDDKGLPAATIAARVREWSSYVEQHVGLTPIIYTGFYFWRDKVGGADFSNHPLWIANYGTSCPLVPPPWARWTFHQYSSSATIPGITANTVDVNRFNGTYTELQALAKLPSDACIVDVTTEEGGIVDDASPCFFAGGDPAYMRTASAGVGASLRWTHATDHAKPASFGIWTLSVAQAGRYRVDVSTPAPFGESRQAVYQVTHGDTRTAVTLDQSAVDGWQTLGDFDFAEGAHGQAIRLDDNTGEPNETDTQIVFDALRFTKLADDDQEDPQQTAPASGCATTHTAGAPSLLLALLFAIGSLVHGAHTRPGRRASGNDARRIRH